MSAATGTAPTSTAPVWTVGQLGLCGPPEPAEPDPPMVDTAAIRAAWRRDPPAELDFGYWLLALCDALDAARAERDRGFAAIAQVWAVLHGAGEDPGDMPADAVRRLLAERDEWKASVQRANRALEQHRQWLSETRADRDTLAAEVRQVTEWWKSEQALRRDVDAQRDEAARLAADRFHALRTVEAERDGLAIQVRDLTAGRAAWQQSSDQAQQSLARLRARIEAGGQRP